MGKLVCKLVGKLVGKLAGKLVGRLVRAYYLDIFHGEKNDFKLHETAMHVSYFMQP